MGQGKPSHFSNNALKKFQDYYVYVAEKHDERWGSIQIWKEKENATHVMLFSKSFHSDADYKSYQAELEARQNLEHPNLLQLVGWSNVDSDGICGHSRKYNLYCEYLSQNLEKEIRRRAKKNVIFCFFLKYTSSFFQISRSISSKPNYGIF